MSVNIGYVFDEGFTVPAAVSIFSLLYHNRSVKDLCIYILDDGIAEESKRKLTQMVNQFGQRIEFVDTSAVRSRLANTTKFNWNGRYSTYIRLMLKSLLPKIDDRLIMIDADTIVNGRIDALFNMDLCGKVCATAYEAMPLSYHRYSGLGNAMLINGGLIMIDMKQWKALDMDQMILDFLTNVREKNMLTDEDVISEILKNRIAVIPPEYNFLVQYKIYASAFYYRFFGWDQLYKHGTFYALDELKKANQKPVILHCIDTFTNRPWHLNNIHPYSQLFDQYLAQTPWHDYEKQIRPMKPLTKLEYTARKLLPSPASVFLYAVAVKLYYGIGAKKYYKDGRNKKK